MSIKVTTNDRTDLNFHQVNSYDENRLSPIHNQIDLFANRVLAKCSTEFTINGSITKDIPKYQITAEKNKSITVKTEYFPIAAKVCSYLQSKGVDYKIELSEKLDFYQDDPDDTVEIYLKKEPSVRVCKEMYGIKDEEGVLEIMLLNFVNFQFTFDTSFFQTNEVTENMVVDALQECEVCFTDNSKQVMKKITKSEISSIKFTNYALEQILEWLQWHRDILNTPYLDLEDVLLENDLIMEEPYV